MATAEDIQKLKGLLELEMARRGVGPAQLARGLAHMGVEADAQEVARRLAAPDLDKTFLLQCFEAAGAPTLHLDF